MPDGLLVRQLGRLISSAAKHRVLNPSFAFRVGRFPRTGIGPCSPRPFLTSAQPALPRFYPQYRSGISIGRNAVFPAFLQQLPSSRRMTVIRATRAISKSSPYPYQSTLSQSYRRRSRASSCCMSSRFRPRGKNLLMCDAAYVLFSSVPSNSSSK
ncbi:hypothetical protein PCANC_22711 [Puccinia coronata f. sp. avenae]|uniref:Uncharacterized protein n=1 Tax=Puccinia coronata f. sp. avenae TaxID=200324 RepID=A0A2N5TPA8_9BASI|nr:hypothetical protein PCANC_22711 [Puccinia coronata f. sp. avenae]